MMVSRDGAFGILIGAAVGTLFLVPAHGSAQDSLSVWCGYSVARLEDHTRCAQQGLAIAQHILGLRYSTGTGAPQDQGEAVRWFRLAAQQGYAAAQHNLGEHYATGVGVPEDDREAVRWHRLAADQGEVRAQYALGLMYALGDGVPEDDVYAYMWANLAAAQGNEDAQGLKDTIEQRMTREQIAEAQRLSREWIESHPPDGDN